MFKPVLPDTHEWVDWVPTHLVPDQGSELAEIAIIGEAPGEWEDLGTLVGPPGKKHIVRIPFCGKSGEVFDRWTSGVGFKRDDFLIMNVFPYRPPNNNFDEIETGELAEHISYLHKKLSTMPNLKLIVPMGAHALHALTGKDRITNWRGSILPYKTLKGKTIKVIPTLHPAATFRKVSWARRCKLDWQRIWFDKDFADLRLPKRTHLIHPTKKQITDFVAELKKHPEWPVASDIETPWGSIACIGFATSAMWSITIPVDDTEAWPKEEDRKWALEIVREILELPNPKIFQNGLFDTFILAQYDIYPVNYIWDTLAMHHCLESGDSHSLEYMASIDTREPYWKSESKDGEDSRKFTKNMDQFHTYNGKDCAVTYELFEVYKERLEAYNQIEFYHNHYTNMFRPLLDIMLHGVAMNDKQRRKRLGNLMVECFNIQDQLEVLAGHPLHAKKTLSVKRLSDFLYKEIGFEGKGTNELQLKKLIQKYTNKVAVARRNLSDIKKKTKKQESVATIAQWQKGLKALNLVIDHRRKFQLSTFLPEARLDKDGRMRCEYRFTTEFGRLSSKKNPLGSGGNLQNQDREIRDLFVPDPGCIFIEADLSQAESRVVGMLTKDEQMIELARRLPWDFDVHKYNASFIFHVEPEQVTKDQRYLGKRAVHASNYGMQGEMLAGLLLKDGYPTAVSAAEAMIRDYLKAFPAISKWQRDTNLKIITYKQLANTWGRVFDFSSDYDELKNKQELFRRAYAAVPQSEVADLLNQWGLIPVWQWLLKTGYGKINAQVHDSLLISVPPQHAYKVMCFVRETLERPRIYAGNSLTIPVEFKVGKSWAGDHEFKKGFPTEKEVNEVVDKIWTEMQEAA